ncbi:MAG: UPF0182 family protein [Acidimicrobiales bacterium]|nr:UPF0182 family protein [Acidimicrobiales bacterium]
MRPPSDMPPPQPRARRPRGEGSNRGRTILIVAAIALFFLVTSLRGIAGFYTDFLWFDSLGYAAVWSGVLGAKISLAVIFVAVFFLICWASLYIADRLAPRFPPAGPEQEALDRFREAIGHRTGVFRAAVAFVLALFMGVGMSQQWREWLLFTNGGDWGRSDAEFGTDIGFYVFQLPFLKSVVDWGFASILIILVVTVAAHFANGGIRVQPTGQGTGVSPTVTSQVKAHVSVLLGVLALIRAGGYFLERYELTTSSRGVVDGASYTDVNAQLPVLYLLIAISVASFLLFIVNIWRRGWVLPLIGVGLWGLVAVVAAGIYPQVIQRFQVDPNELARETPFIERNISATRDAIGLQNVESNDYQLNRDGENVDLSDNEDTVTNIRLWDPSEVILGQTFARLEELLPYYRINDVDVDRYEVDGETTQVVMSARGLNTSGLPQSSWEAEHVIYTHGYGMVMAPGTTKTEQGRPNFILEQVPVESSTDIEISRPQIYFGENLNGYVITGATRPELDFQIEGETETTTYEGADGVDIGGIVNKAAFGLRFADYNTLITSLIDGDSKIHYIRDVKERVQTLAPFLEFDADPYPVIDDEGEIKWVIDAYTTTDRYPYGQQADNSGLPAGSQLDGNFNYVRNSVKAVVDAYEGTVDMYVIDPDDPIIQAWRGAFPELFTDFDEMPDDLVDNLRYPEDLFRVQTNMWGEYHVEDPGTFYNNNDAWNVALDPGTAGAGGTTQATNAAGQPVGPARGARIDPYYLLTQLPGEDSAEFVMLRSFVPIGGDQNQLLTAFMVARSDPEHYGELVTYEMPRGSRPDGPAIVADAIQSDPIVSEQQTLLGGGGSRVKFGNLILVPVDNSLIYVRPFYVESDQVEIPELKKVIAFFESDVAIDDTLEGALGQLLGEVPSFEEVVDAPDPESQPDGEEPADGEEPSDGDEPDDGDEPATGGVNQRAAELLEEAEGLFQDAQSALEAGNLGEYQSLTQEAEALVSEALQLLATSTTTTTAPATTTTTVPEEEEA